MRPAPAPFPWDDLLAYCLTRLRWTPPTRNLLARDAP